jgi:hypothetical protein
MSIRPCESGRPPLWARQVGSKDDNPWPPVPSAEVASSNHVRPAGVTDRVQRVRDPVIASSLDESAVLSNEPTRSDFIDDADGVIEEVVGVEASTAADGGVLAAGRGARNKINLGDAVGAEALAAEGSEVIVLLHLRIVLGVERAPPGHRLAGRNGGDSGAVQTQRPCAGRA